MYIYPYKTGSRSVNQLARAVPLRKIRLENSRFVGGPNKIVINWGAPSILNREIMGCDILNSPIWVQYVSNKLLFFQDMPADMVPQWTDSRLNAQRWARDGHLVVCRTLLRASGGRGIVIAARPDDVVPCALYVKYVKKTEEYRVHVFLNEVIDVQRKARRHDTENVNWQVRNHQNGFVFVRENVEAIPYLDRLKVIALRTVTHMHLEFGAVDIIYNEHENRLYVLEVNTAPGLEGSTVDSYVNAIRRI